MSINLRLGTFTRSDGTLNSTSDITAFKVKKLWIDQHYDSKDRDEKFTILITEENGAEHRISLYCSDANTQIDLSPEADRRLNGIPQAARGSIVNMVVPNDAIDYGHDTDRSDDVIRNTTPLD